MKNLLFIAITLLTVFVAGAQKGSFKCYDYPNFKLHVYYTGDALGDASFIIEGSKKIVTLEHPLFKENIKEFNDYITAIGKPIDVIIANYHTGGYADFNKQVVVMTEGMPEFEKGEIYGGMIQNFATIFGDKIDVRPHKKANGIKFNTQKKWADIAFEFSRGASTDFPAASILIDKKVYFTHWAPTKNHMSNLQLNSAAAIDAEIIATQEALNSGAELFIGSHGGVASKTDAIFRITYLTKVKEIYNSTKNADVFAQKLIAAFPYLSGADGVKALAASIYPNWQNNSDEAAVKTVMNEYFRSVSLIDKDLARKVWSQREDISLINALGHFFGFQSIFNDFIVKSFGELKSRNLHSSSEVVKIYGNFATVELYWLFDIVTANDKADRRSGRETLFLEKTNDKWQIVHVHYSGMPKI